MYKEKKKTKSDAERESWQELEIRINELVYKVNDTNLNHILSELFELNLIRGRALFCRSCFKSQISSSPVLADVIAALISAVNSRFHLIGDLLLKRTVLQIRSGFDRGDRLRVSIFARLLAHLVNHRVAGESIALELLLKLLDKPTVDNVEVAVDFVRECGAAIREVSPSFLDLVFDRFVRILREVGLDSKSRCLIDDLVDVRRSNFKDHPAIRLPLSVLVDRDELVTHEISLLDVIDGETCLDVFKPDPKFRKNEKKYKKLKRQILGHGRDDGSDDDDDDDEEGEVIKDHTETDLVNLRRTIYKIIMSSLDIDEAGQKILQMKLEPGQELELCVMLLGCCTEERTYRPFFGHLAHRFCLVSGTYRECFENLFVEQYSTAHRLETNKLRNVAMFFAQLLAADALPWDVLACVRLTEEDTTSSSRIFVKTLFLKLCDQLGLKSLNEKLQDPTMEEKFESIFPKDHPKNTKFSINFFTSIGLGSITHKLRNLDTDYGESKVETERKPKRRRS
ncbi:unnamed protein product [Cochlearia groenlandica]